MEKESVRQAVLYFKDDGKKQKMVVTKIEFLKGFLKTFAEIVELSPVGALKEEMSSERDNILSEECLAVSATVSSSTLTSGVSTRVSLSTITSVVSTRGSLSKITGLLWVGDATIPGCFVIKYTSRIRRNSSRKGFEKRNYIFQKLYVPVGEALSAAIFSILSFLSNDLGAIWGLGLSDAI